MDSTQRAFRFTLCATLAVVVFAIVHGLIHSGNPSRYFGEGRYTTAVSCFQLLLTAFFSFSIFRTRKAAADSKWMAGYWVWLIMGGGFVFLAADDALQIHERIGHAINKLLPFTGTPFAGRADDAVIGIYGLIGLFVLWLFRREILEFRVILRFLGIGFVFMFLSVICDSLGHHDDIFLKLTGEIRSAKRLQAWADVGDGGFTLLAEGMFAAGFYCGWRQAKAGTAALPLAEPMAKV
jgi:hypothetical protein